MPRRLDLRLIVITDAAMAAPRSIRDVVRAALAGGAPAVQLRDKSASARELFEQARQLRELTKAAKALLFVNDRLDVALAAGADGVHLGPTDLPLASVSVAVPPDFLIGVSTDDPAAARAAQQAGASYIGCGAVFGTTSKPEVVGEAIGLERLRQVCQAVSIPVVGIGGIDQQTVQAVAQAGAAGAAVIGAVMRAEDVEQTVRSLLVPFRI